MVSAATPAAPSSGRLAKFDFVTVNVRADDGAKPVMRIFIGAAEKVLLIETNVIRPESRLSRAA